MGERTASLFMSFFAERNEGVNWEDEDGPSVDSDSVSKVAFDRFLWMGNLVYKQRAKTQQRNNRSKFVLGFEKDIV
jgi:hypothetical protein